ncbi:MAG: acyl-CoA thioesterase [Pseudomonadota bacterium]
MYPFIRFALAVAAARRAPALSFEDAHVSNHRCMPWDLDPWGELNNGRTLTLLDIGRFSLGVRTGMVAALQREGWGLTVAGTSVRYRRRIKLFDLVRVQSRAVGRDARFLYIHQTIWLGETPACSALLRKAVTSADGIVPTDRLLAAVKAEDWDPELPAWVQAWCEAEDARPWPPDDVRLG